jgi:hypothetical protein
MGVKILTIRVDICNSKAQTSCAAMSLRFLTSKQEYSNVTSK